MRNILLALLMISSSLTACAQGIVFESGTWNEVLMKSKQENKPIFVDLYTTWCAPCKLMEKDVFPQAAVGNYYNEHFINYQIDGEKGEGRNMVKKYKIQGYPTFLFIDCDGSLIYQFIGMKDVRSFLDEAQKVTVYAKYGGWEKMEADFKANKPDAAFMFDYYTYAEEHVKPYALNSYLKTLTDEQLFDKDNKMIESISVYDVELLNRLAKGLVALNSQDEKLYFNITFPLLFKLSEFLGNAIDNGDEKTFNEILKLQTQIHTLARTQDSDIKLRQGRGLFFISPELLQLCYNMKNQEDATLFKKQLIVYLNQFTATNNPDVIQKKREPLLNLKRTDSLFFKELREEFVNEYVLICSYLLDFTDYYWRNSPSDSKTKKECARWVSYTYSLNPYSPTIPCQAADLLVRLGHKKEAIALLEKALDAQIEIGTTDIKLWKNMELKLRDVKNDK